MGLRIVIDRKGAARLAGLKPEFAQYEKEITSGRQPCPFTVEFRDSLIVWESFFHKGTNRRYKKPTVPKKGLVVANRPIALTPAGKPKIELFRSE